MRRRLPQIALLCMPILLVPGPVSLAAAPLPGQTGNLLVVMDRGRAATAAGRSAVAAVIASHRARAAGFQVPQIGLITVRPAVGIALNAFAATLRRLPGVASVQIEHRYAVRLVPNDPALAAFDPSSGVGQWALGREGFYKAWNISRGDGALVGVIDTGIDASSPELSSKIAAAVEWNPSDTGSPRTDEVGHGTHVASLACAATNNAIGLAGAGFNCRLVVEKSDFSDSTIAAAIVDATDRHVQAINMSFGPPGPANAGPAPSSEVRALDYAAARKVVLVAAGADTPGTEQGDPANVLQPMGSGSNLFAGIGLDVTAADYNGARASFAGGGSEVSLAAFGAFDANAPKPPLCLPREFGLIGAFPATATQLESAPSSVCRASLQGSNRYAYLAGTSMAAPQVAAVGAMMRVLNPYATLTDVLDRLKLTAQRPAGSGYSNDLGWGILNAGAALAAIRRVDRLAPVSTLSAPRLAHRRAFLIRWTGHDLQRPGLIAAGIAFYDVYVRVNRARPRLLEVTHGHSLRFRARRGSRYAFYTIAVDRAGNRESRPADAVTRVAGNAR